MRFLHSTMQRRPACFQSKSYLQNGYRFQTHMETQWWMLMLRVAAVNFKLAAWRNHLTDMTQGREGLPSGREWRMVSEGSWWPRGVSSENLRWWEWSSGQRQKSCLFTYRLILLSFFHWRLFRIFFRTHHQPQHEAAHSLSDLRRYVVAKLLQCGQKALQLAELPGTASWRELLVGKGGSWGHGRPITEAVRSGWSTIKRCRRVTAPIQHCQETEWRDDMNPLFCWSVRGMWQIWGCDDARSSLTPYIVQITHNTNKTCI